MAFRRASRVAGLHFSRASRKNGDGQLDQIVVIAFGGEIIEDDVLVEVIVKLQMMFLCVGEQLETVRVNIFIAMRVVEHQKSAAAAQRDLFTVNIRQLRRMHIGVEFRVLIAVRGDRITRNRGADGVSAVKTERLTKSKMLAQSFGNRALIVRALVFGGDEIFIRRFFDDDLADRRAQPFFCFLNLFVDIALRPGQSERCVRRLSLFWTPKAESEPPASDDPCAP